ncbi:hypothetical protein TNCV_2318741 [Trichonephila clavipes]|nr:hypothetical protein TNCV_2318741 [Trichonephila clavipes]
MSSDNLREEDSSEDNMASGNISSDIASNNMNASLDKVASDNKPLEDPSKLLDNIASNNMQLDKMDNMSSDNMAK